MSIIASNCQHCDQQQFRTLSCVHCTIFSVLKSNLFIRALLLDRILVTEKTTPTPRVHLVCNVFRIIDSISPNFVSIIMFFALIDSSLFTIMFLHVNAHVVCKDDQSEPLCICLATIILS